MNNIELSNKKSLNNASIYYKFVQILAKTLTNTSSFGTYIEPIIQLFSPNWKYEKTSATITAVSNESSNVYTLELKQSSKWQTYEAGQFIQLSAEVNGALITRTFSISSEPEHFKAKGKIELTIRSQENGLFTPWLHTTAQPGKTVYISKADGDFTLKNKQAKKLFIAAGSGITAIRPILKQYKNETWFKESRLLFYVKNKEERLFQADLDALKDFGLTYQYIFSDDSGRISQDLSLIHISEPTRPS